MDKRPEDGFAFDASISTSNGSAAQPGDYTQVDDTVTFSRNDFSRVTINGERRYRAAKQVPVPIQDDTSDEDEEDFTVTIEYADPSPLHLQGGSAAMSVKITDNDFVPVTISWDQSFVSVDEDATTVTLQARATTTSDKMPESGFTVALSATDGRRHRHPRLGLSEADQQLPLRPGRLHAHRLGGSNSASRQPGTSASLSSMTPPTSRTRTSR